MPSAKSYVKSAAPHIRDSETIAGIYWKYVASLIPLIAAALFLFRLEALRVLVLSLITGLVAEWAITFFSKKKFRGLDGSTVFFSLLFALLSPPNLPGWVIALEIFLVIGIFKELPGGLGSYPIHPVTAVLLIHHIFSPSSLILSGAAPAAILSGVFLLLFRWIRFELPIFYLLGWMIPAAFLNKSGEWPLGLSDALIWVAAFFLITDVSLAPIKPKGRKISVFLAGMLGAALTFTGVKNGILAALILVQTFSPWMDAWILSKGVRKQTLKIK